MKSVRALFLCLLPLLASAQQTDLLKDLRYRLIGPFRGGRVLAVSGVPSQPNVYYFGATGGGVWKTTNSGVSWEPISDGQFKTGSVGAIAVADSDPNVIYVGMGESCVRGNASNGDGVYKSVDGGKTWRNVGLQDTYHIGAVRVHPRNPDIVYVAALGHLWGPNEQRGVFRSTDGGQTWKQILTRGSETGAVDLALDPSNPRIMYASFWQINRTPWHMESGGPNSGLWKSTDGGDNWTDISHAPGLPRGVEGRIGVTVSPANPDRVWAIVEASDGGVFRSDNGGKNWTKTNEQNILRQRAWYYSHIFAGPKNPDEVYVLNVGMYRSTDGGRSYAPIQAPHGDTHDLWIAPDDPNRMIESNDGGATVSSDGGTPGPPSTISPPRSSTASRSTKTFRITSMARSRTIPPSASPAVLPAPASRLPIGTTSAAARVAGSRPIRAIPRSFTPAPMATSSPARISTPARCATSTPGPTIPWAMAPTP